MTIRIIGAGMAGLLAGNMLRHRATIYEKQSSLPNNHSALLRFRSDIVSKVLGVPFKKVRMIKSVYGNNSNPIANSIMYAAKVSKQYRTDRSLPIGVVQDDRYIAPDNLIELMAEPLDIKFDTGDAGFVTERQDGWSDTPIISTIPMPDLVKKLGYNKKIEFNSRPTAVITAEIKDCEAYATLYYPTHNHSAYRASITGNKLIIEFPFPLEKVNNNDSHTIAIMYAEDFGIPTTEILNVQYKEQQYGKIIPVDDELRKDFMHWATDNFNIYSLGRYATWRPGLLLDDLVHDVSLISQWIMKGGKYGLRKHRA